MDVARGNVVEIKLDDDVKKTVDVARGNVVEIKLDDDAPDDDVEMFAPDDDDDEKDEEQHNSNMKNILGSLCGISESQTSTSSKETLFDVTKFTSPALSKNNSTMRPNVSPLMENNFNNSNNKHNRRRLFAGLADTNDDDDEIDTTTKQEFVEDEASILSHLPPRIKRMRTDLRRLHYQIQRYIFEEKGSRVEKATEAFCEELREFVETSRNAEQENFVRDIERVCDRVSKQFDSMFRTSQRALNEQAKNFKSGLTSKLDRVRRELESKRRDFDNERCAGFDHPYSKPSQKEKFIQNVVNSVQVEILKIMKD